MQVDIMLLLLYILELSEFQDRLHELKPIAEKLQAIIDAAEFVEYTFAVETAGVTQCMAMNGLHQALT